jgi:AraC-like DNA-binding protein
MQHDANQFSPYVLIVIGQIKQHIDSDPFQFKKASELLIYLNISNRNHISQAFRVCYDTGIANYLILQRLEASKKLLDQPISIRTIALKCYYKKQSSYTKAFKRAYKMTPSQWQRLDT